MSSAADTLNSLQRSLLKVALTKKIKDDDILIQYDLPWNDLLLRAPDIITGASQLAFFGVRIPDDVELKGISKNHLPEDGFRFGSVYQCGLTIRAFEAGRKNAEFVRDAMQRVRAGVRNMLQLLAGSQNPDERPPQMEAYLHRFAADLHNGSGVCAQSLEKTFSSAFELLEVTMEISVGIASTKGNADQVKVLSELQKAIEEMAKWDEADRERKRKQYVEEMTKHVSQAEKRFGDAAKDLPNGGDLLGMQIGLRLANNAASGLPVLLRKESTSQQIATIALSETILKASSAETQKKGEGLHLGDLKALNQGQLDQLNSPIFVDADHIFSLLTVFYKVLTSGSGDKPNWGDITQDKSVWTYVKKGLEELGKTEYGSSALGAQGKSIVNNTVKLVDEIKNYSANQTAGRVTDIVNEVKGLREQAEKLVAAASLKRCKTAYPMPQQDQINFPDLVNNSIATLAAQTWGHQLATILEQLDGSRALYKVTRDDKLATLDQSKRFRATLKPLSEGSPNWDSLQRMLVGLIHAIAQMTLELQHLRAISAIMVASIDVISTACDAYSRRSGPTSDVKLGGITPQDYGFKTIIAHLGNFTSVANVLERAVQTYSDLFDRQFTRGFMLLQKADLGVEVPGDRVERSCRELLEWASSTEPDLKNAIERMQTEIEKEIDQRLVELRDNFRFVGGDLTSASIKKAREEHIVELTAALQSAPRQI